MMRFLLPAALAVILLTGSTQAASAIPGCVSGFAKAFRMAGGICDAFLPTKI
jgi:hypothetical protein